jgi:XTP/dITP diphosphohydrolase
MFMPDGHSRTFGEMSSEEKHGLPVRHQAEWTPVSRPDGAPIENGAARSDAKPDSTFADRAARGKGLSHRARAFIKLAEACLV